MYDRTKTIGGSDAVMIWSGQWAELYDRKLTEAILRPPQIPLAARIGTELQSLNLIYFSEQTGISVEEHEDEDTPYVWADGDWCVALPDGRTKAGIPVEAKAVNPFWKPQALIDKYMPQLQHIMRVLDQLNIYLSVFYLNMKWEYYEIPYDPIYDATLRRMEEQFAWHLQEGIRP